MKLTCFIISIISASYAIIGHFVELEGAMTGGIIISTLFLGFANLDKLSSFEASLTGIKAVVRKAETTLDELRLVATSVASSQIATIVRASRLNLFTDDEVNELIKLNQTTLEQLKVSESEITKILADLHRFNRIGYVEQILDPSAWHNNEEHLKMVHYRLARQRPDAASVSEIESFLEEVKHTSPKQREWLDLYKYYVENLEHKDLKKWNERQRPQPHWELPGA